jgi:hypothetical protein
MNPFSGMGCGLCAAILYILLWIRLIITLSCDLRHIETIPREFNVPTDTLWGELSAENAALDSDTFLFTGLRSVLSGCIFTFYFLSQG